MVTFRTVLAGACLTLAMLTAGACAQVNEAVNGRDLECVGGVPDDICTSLADNIVSIWAPANVAHDGPIVRVLVKPMNCGGIVNAGPAIVRCWNVEASTSAIGSDGAGIGGAYYQNVDGQIFDDAGLVVGTFPVE